MPGGPPEEFCVQGPVVPDEMDEKVWQDGQAYLMRPRSKSDEADGQV